MRCLGCYKEIEKNADTEWHPACARRLFGTVKAPTLEYSLSDMQSLAAKILRNHTGVTGVQHKISLAIASGDRGRGNRRLTLVGLWGYYILKPPNPDYPELPELEDVTMHMASAFGLATVPHGLIHLASGELAYITKRIDRNKQHKLAMEDFCQLSGRLTEDKYKGSLENIGKVLDRYSEQPGLDKIKFYENILFSYITGNADMHLKNYSLFGESTATMRLSPAYDLVPTKLLVPKDIEEVALTLNGKKSNLRLKDFRELAERLEIQAKVQESVYLRLFKSLPKFEALIRDSFVTANKQYEYIDLIHQRINRLSA